MILPPFAVGYPMIQALRRPRRPLVATNALTLTLNQPVVTQRLAGKSRSAPAAHFLPSGAQGRRSPHGACAVVSTGVSRGSSTTVPFAAARHQIPIVGPDCWARWLGRRRTNPFRIRCTTRLASSGGRRLILSARCIVSPKRLVRVSRSRTGRPAGVDRSSGQRRTAKTRPPPSPFYRCRTKQTASSKQPAPAPPAARTLPQRGDRCAALGTRGLPARIALPPPRKHVRDAA
jgi:hypothetical protein